MKEFNNYKGTKVDFCKKHNVKKYQLDYYMKKYINNKKTTFQSIELTETNISESKEGILNESNPTEIGIEVGSTKIYIANAEENLILNIIGNLLNKYSSNFERKY